MSSMCRRGVDVGYFGVEDLDVVGEREGGRDGFTRSHGCVLPGRIVDDGMWVGELLI